MPYEMAYTMPNCKKPLTEIDTVFERVKTAINSMGMGLC